MAPSDAVKICSQTFVAGSFSCLLHLLFNSSLHLQRLWTSYWILVYLLYFLPIFGFTRVICKTKDAYEITLKIPSTSRSHSRCFVCKRPGPKLVCLSADGRLSTFLEHNVVIPAGSRCCPRHIHEGVLIHSAVTSIQTKTDTTKLNRIAINDLLQKLRSLCLQMNKSLNFDSLNDSDYPSLTRLTKPQFDDVCRHLSDKVKNSPSRSSRTSIGIFLVKLCSGMSNRLLSTIFGITKSSVHRAVSTVRQAFMRGFVPLYLGIDSLTRESVIRDHTHDLAKTLFGTADDQVILVLDGTYIYINKSNNFQFQRRTYCTHKGRPLVKPTVVVTTTGYFVTIVGPYLSDSKNNDASILNHMLLSNIEDIRGFLKDGDVFVVDRGFRDSVKLLKELGIQAEMPSILSKEHRQMSTEEANSSRLVTKIGIRGAFLGWTFGLGILITLNTATWTSFGLYLAFLSFFHWSEYFIMAVTNPRSLTLESYLLDHSKEYKLAAVASWIEFTIEVFIFPGLKQLKYVHLIGALAVIVGETIRKSSMITASTNFNHYVQCVKQKDHHLVKHGIYSLCRHPSYVGWFLWSIGTQVILCNPVCLVGYTVASWRFFRERIYEEELYLCSFFGDEYTDYQRRVGTGIPFIYGYVEKL